MNLLKFIINRKNNDITCSICFKTSENLVKLTENIAVFDGTSLNNESVLEILNEFRGITALTPVVCWDCLSVVVKCYILLHGHKSILCWLASALQHLNKQIDMKITQLNDGESSKYVIKVQLPKGDMAFDIPEIQVVSVKNDLSEEDLSSKSADGWETLQASDAKVQDGFECTQCERIFKKRKQLYQHSFSHKSKECPYCKKVLKLGSHYKLHLEGHRTGATRTSKWKRTKYTCSDCGYSCYNNDELEAHMNKHQGIRPYVCDICTKGYYSQQRLNSHMNMHTKAKQVQCELCELKFCTNSSLKTHFKRRHCDDKPFKCHVCNFSCTTLSRRNDHVKVKHSEKSNLCTLCGKLFGAQYLLNRHMKESHKVKTKIKESV